MLDSFIVRSLTAFSIIYLILVSISSLTGLKFDILFVFCGSMALSGFITLRGTT